MRFRPQLSESEVDANAAAAALVASLQRKRSMARNGAATLKKSALPPLRGVENLEKKENLPRGIPARTPINEAEKNEKEDTGTVEDVTDSGPQEQENDAVLCKDIVVDEESNADFNDDSWDSDSEGEDEEV